MLPKHIGFILDGNRRWARSQNLPIIEGHRRGYKTLQTIAQAAFELGVKYVSAYVFSNENWQRSQDEVNGIMKILGWALDNEVKKFHDNNYRLLVSGRRDRLNQQLVQRITKAEELTAHNTAGTIMLCIDYGGQQEIIQAVQQALHSGTTIDDLDADALDQYMYVPDVPAPDLIIRTSGERRLSNYLLWQSGYSELLFVDKNWPEFTTDDLQTALDDYAGRKRRFGS